MSEVDRFLDKENNQSGIKPERRAAGFSPAQRSNVVDQEQPQQRTSIDRFLEGAPAQDKGVTGVAKDLGLSFLQGAARTPGSVVAAADSQLTGGRVSRAIDEAGLNFGEQIADRLSEHHTEKYKQQQQGFEDAGEDKDFAGRTLDKASYAIRNPSLIAGTVAQSLPDMIAGGFVGGRLSRATGGRVSPEAGAALGEGYMMMGHQAENVRSQTEDGLLTPEQRGYVAGTGALGALFGWGGNRLARRLGVADVDTLIAQGVTPQEIAANIAQMPAKSVPKAIVQGAISEGFLEELPQEVSETILENLALGKDWNEGLEDALVMAPLAGMAMGGPVSGYGAYRSNRARAAQQEGDQEQAPEVTPEQPPQETRVAEEQIYQASPPPQVQEQYRREGFGFSRPSERMGINPDDGPLSTAAAMAVDNALPHIPPPPIEGEYLAGQAQEPMPQDRQVAFDRSSQYTVDAYGNIVDIDGNPVPYQPGDMPQIEAMEPRQDIPPRPEMWEVDSDGGARRTVNQSEYEKQQRERYRTERVDLSSLDRGEPRSTQQTREEIDPVVDAQSAWESMNSFERNRIAQDAMGKRGVVAKNTATKSWDKLSEEERQSVVAAVEEQRQRGLWIDPNTASRAEDKPVLQNRDRSSKASIEQMNSIAGNPDYNRLSFSRDFGNGAPVVEQGANLPQDQMGISDTTATSQGRQIPVQYAVVEADQLLASNNSDGTTNSHYAEGSEGLSRAIAGNGRVAGLQSAWERGTAQQYKESMLNDQTHGIDPQVIDAMDKPVLVRIMPSDQISENIGDESNISGQSELSSVEQAKTDTRRLDLSLLKFGEDGDITTDSVSGFINSMPVSERAALLDGDRPSRRAIERLEAAIFQQAYGNEELTRLQAEAVRGEARNIVSGLMQAAPSMARLEGAGIYDIRPLVAEAAEVAINARRAGQPLKQFIQQNDFGRNPEIMPILEMMADDYRSAQKMGEKLKTLAQISYSEGNKASSDMFGEVPKADPRQIMDSAFTGEELRLDGQENAEGVGKQSRTELDAQDTSRSATDGRGQEVLREQQSKDSEGWRRNYIQASKVARELGIDPRQHKKLASLVAAIDANNSGEQTGIEVSDSTIGQVVEPRLHVQGSEDITKALADIARKGVPRVLDDGGVTINGELIATFPEKITSVNQLIELLATELRSQLEEEGVTIPANPADMTRDQFVVAYEFANLIPEFEVLGHEIGSIVTPTSSGLLSVDPDALYDKIQADNQGSQEEPLLETYSEQDLTDREEANQQAEREQTEQARREEEAISQQEEREYIRSQSEQAAENFELGQTAEENITGQRNMFSEQVTSEEVDAKANEADTSPSEEQKEAGNYKKGHIRIHGLDITIENPKGSKRTGVDEDGNTWSVTMKNHYGYIKRTEGADGDQVDVFIGDSPESTNVYVVDQVNQDGGFDEHKVMIGFNSRKEAVDAYRSNYEDGWQVGEVNELGIQEFKQWLKDGDTTKPLSTEGSEPQTIIENVGEHLEGSRKDRARALAETISQELTDEQIVNEPLSKIWPKKTIDEIEDKFTAAFATAARDEIPTKPRRSYRLASWVNKVKSMRELTNEMLEGKITKADIEKHSKNHRGLKDFFSKVTVLELVDREHWGRIKEVQDNPNSYRYGEDGKTRIPTPHISVKIDKRWVRFNHTSIDDAIDDIKEALGEVKKGPKVPDASRYEIRGSSGSYFINRKGDREYRSLKRFNDLSKAREYLKNNLVELNDAWEAIKERDNVSKADVRRKENRERAAKDWRQGKDVSAEKFSEEFGFRGVQFGDWVSQGKEGKERQGMVNQAYDALMDLADILDIPPKAISLNGSLGMAFGSRGRGWASAHYEPSTLVINLTKTRGAGTLAHEWFHALDNYFSHQRHGGEVSVAGGRGSEDLYRRSNFITYRPEPMYVLKDGASRVRHAPLTKAELNRRRKSSPNTEIYNPENWQKDPSHPDGVRPEVERAFAELVEALDNSPMSNRSSVLDRSPDQYWSQIIERGARAFENYVIHKMMQNGYQNDYLANVTPIELFPRSEDRYPYLTETEIEPVAEAFDNLFGIMETREDERGNVALFSRGGREYIPGQTLTDTNSFVSAIEESMPSLSEATRKILQLGEQGKKGGAVFIEGRDAAKIAKVYSEKTGIPLAQAQSLLSDADTANAFYDVRSGITFLIGGNLNENNAAAVLLHEMMHSDQRASIDNMAMELLESRDNIRDKNLRDFIDRVEAQLAQAGESFNPLEAASYIVEQAVLEGRSEGYTMADNKFINWIEKTIGKPVADLIRNIVKNARQWMLRNGIGIQQITIDDLVQYSINALESNAKKVGGREVVVIDDDQQIQRSHSQQDQINTPVISGVGENLITLYHGTDADGYSGITEDGFISGPVFLTPDKEMAENYSPDGTDPIELLIPAEHLKVDFDLAGGRVLDIEQANSYTGNDGWSIEDYLDRRNSVAVESDVYIREPNQNSLNEALPRIQAQQEPSNPDIRYSRAAAAAEHVMNVADTLADRVDKWTNKDRVTPSSWTDGQKAAASKFDTFMPRQPVSARLREIKEVSSKRFMQLVFDQFRPLQDLSQKAFMQAHLSRGSEGSVEAIATRGVPYIKDGAIAVRSDENGFMGKLAQLGDMEEVRKFLMWVAANRAERLMGEGRENLFTQEDIDSMKGFATGTLKNGKIRAVEYANTLKELNKYNKAVLDIAQEAGLINGDARKTWESEFYVPFYRVMQNEDGTVSNQYTYSDDGLLRKEVIKRLKGGQGNLGDPLENILSNWNSLISASMKNMAANEALIQGVELGVSEPTSDTKGNNIWTLQDGKRVYWNVHDKNVLEALESLNFNGYNNGLMKAAGKFKRMLTTGVTYSPTFRIRSLIRDTLHGMAVSDLSYNPVANMINGWQKAGKNSDVIAQMMAGGGAIRFGAMEEGQSADYMRRMIREGKITEEQILNTPEKFRNAINDFMNRYQELGDRMESVNRAEVYTRVLERTGSHLEASFAARDVMNYTSMGSAAIIRAMAQVLPFFNARMQGLNKLVRGANEDPRRFWSVVGTIGMASAALYLMQAGDDEYDALPDYVRDTYWPIKLGDKWLYIPKPFEVGVLGTVIERATELAVAGDDYQSKDFARTLGSLLINNLSLNPVPQVILPAAEVWYNYDMFRDAPIDSMAMQRLLPEERYTANTSAGAVFFGQTLGASPQKIEHLVVGYLGWLGTQVLNVSDMLGRTMMDMPSSTKWDMSQSQNWFIVGDFLKEEGSTPSKYSNRFYEVQREINQIYATANAARGVGDMDRYRELMDDPKMQARPQVSSATNRMNLINRQIRNVTADKQMSSSEKTQRLRELYNRRESIAKSIDAKSRAS